MLRQMYYTSLVRQEISFHDMPENASGKLCAALATEVTLIQALTGETLGILLSQVFVCVVTIAVSFWLGDWQVTLVMLACIPLLSAAMSIWLLVASGDAGGEASLGKDAGKIIGDVTTSTRTVSSFTSEQRFLDDFDVATVQHLKDTQVKQLVLQPFAFGWSDGCMLWIFGLMFWFGGIRLASGDADFRSYWIPVFCMFYLGMGIGQTITGVTDQQKAKAASLSVFRAIDRKSNIDYSSTEGKKPRTCAGRIELKDVHFTYPARPDQQVCNGYNLVVEPGQTVALCGASGSGKSTAIQLIERFYDPDSGSVQLDGVDLRELNVRWLREQIGLVSQEPVLFGGTIAENIGMGKPGATKDEIVAAAKMSNAHDFIMTFPSGYETNVGEKGGQLSGGQKQRVAIARAMIKDPSVLLLDEATSALDTESERIVQAALDDLLTKQKRTTIVIAHRLSTIRDADKICVVNAGRVVEEGTHDELMAKRDFYYALNGGA